MRDRALASADESSAREASGEVVAPEKLSAKAGLYYNAASGALRKLSVEDGQLKLEMGAGRDLRPTGPDRFEVVGTRYHLEFTRSAEDQTLQLHEVHETEGVNLYSLVTVEDPTVDRLAEYAGEYYSGELGVAYRLALEEGALQVHRPKASPDRLEPAFEDAFLGHEQVTHIVFVRDADGQVFSFDATTPRIRRVRFLKQGEAPLLNVAATGVLSI